MHSILFAPVFSDCACWELRESTLASAAAMIARPALELLGFVAETEEEIEDRLV